MTTTAPAPHLFDEQALADAGLLPLYEQVCDLEDAVAELRCSVADLAEPR